MKKPVEVKIDSLRVSLTNQQRIVVLKEVDKDRYLPIWIGPYEAESITIALQEIEVSRPQTHDLLKNVLGKLDAQLVQVVISDLKDDIFYSTLVVKTKDKEIKIDSRPSDAISIAVREHVPIMVTAGVMEEASIIPEEISLETEEENRPKESGQISAGEDRLSIFEDYLKKRTDDDDDDVDKLNSGEGESPPKT